MLDLFGDEYEPPVPGKKPEKPKPDQTRSYNPLLKVYGSGTEGQICKDCIHLRYSQAYAAKHWKCDLGELTHSARTDHKVNWPSCGRYEARTEPYSGG